MEDDFAAIAHAHRGLQLGDCGCRSPVVAPAYAKTGIHIAVAAVAAGEGERMRAAVLPVGLGLLFLACGNADGVAYPAFGAFAAFAHVAGFNVDSFSGGVAAAGAVAGELVGQLDIQRGRVREVELPCGIGDAAERAATGDGDADGNTGLGDAVLCHRCDLRERRACGQGFGGRRTRQRNLKVLSTEQKADWASIQ